MDNYLDIWESIQARKKALAWAEARKLKRAATRMERQRRRDAVIVSIICAGLVAYSVISLLVVSAG